MPTMRQHKALAGEVTSMFFVFHIVVNVAVRLKKGQNYCFAFCLLTPDHLSLSILFCYAHKTLSAVEFKILLCNNKTSHLHAGGLFLSPPPGVFAGNANTHRRSLWGPE